jgi:hypothetical protein
MMAPWVELSAPTVQTAPSGDKRWHSVPARHSDSTPVGVLEPAVRQEESALPAAEPVELGVPEVLETSGPVPPAAAAGDEAGTAAVTAGTAEVASAAAGAGTEAECCCQMQQKSSSSSCP